MARNPSQALADVRNRVSHAVSQILTLIRERELKIGDSLPSESTLALQLGVSKVTLREANRALAALGVIDIGNGRPARVSSPSQNVLHVLIGHAVQTQHATIQQVLDVRRAIERRTVALAALRRSQTEADHLCALAAAMRKDLARPEAVMQHDIAFHTAIAAAARNPLMALFMGGFEPVTQLTWPVGWRARTTEADRKNLVEVHEAIAESIRAQDVAAAETAIDRHFDDTVKALVTAGIV